MSSSNDSVLIIDDDDIDRASISRVLRRTQYQTHEVSTAKAAYAFLAEQAVGCILLDYRLPEASGLDILSSIQDQGLSDAPVIILTGLEDQKVITNCLQAGAQDYLIKSDIQQAMLTKAISFATERKQLELELRDAKVAAEQASKAKSAFLANMSHELRTPLNSLLVFSQLFASNIEGNLSAAQIEQAETMHESGQTLLELINDILDLSKVEAGKFTLVVEPVSFTYLAGQLSRGFDHMVIDRPLTFTVNVSEALPELVATDMGRLLQVMKNLVSNALKFTEQGEVSVTFKPDSKRPETHFMVSVKDTGIGIAESDLQAIFSDFYQVDGSVSRRYAGTGLGLAIATRFTELLGGSLRVESTLNEGSEFFLSFPITWQNSAANEMVSVHETQLSEPEPKKKGEPGFEASSEYQGQQLLLVDDNQQNIIALTQPLSKMGFDVSTATSGQAILDDLSLLQNIDIVLMDMMMPEPDGFDTIKVIRAHYSESELPVIAVTAMCMEGDKQRCLDAGATDYVSKPVNLNDLSTAIRQQLNK